MDGRATLERRATRVPVGRSHAAILVGALVVVCVVLAGVSRADAARRPSRFAGPISWADAKHRYGWVKTKSGFRFRCSARDRTRAWARLCATDDGGRHWHRIFGSGATIGTFLRWSKSAGVLDYPFSGRTFWTRDGGRHWWATSAFSGHATRPKFYVGRGHRGRRELRSVVRDFAGEAFDFRVVGWVPKGPLECAGEWGKLGADTTGPSNVCVSGPAGSDGIGLEPVGPTVKLTVVVKDPTSTAPGMVRGPGMNCTGVCTASVPAGSTVALQASRHAVHWAGCSQVRHFPDGYRVPEYWSSVCSVQAETDVEITATFGVAPDGSGAVRTHPAWAATGSRGNTVLLAYTPFAPRTSPERPRGWVLDGVVAVEVPDGWSAPSTEGHAPGYTTASEGTVSVSGRTVVVSGVSLAPVDELVITYGARTGGGPGADAPDQAGLETWLVKQRSLPGGTLTELATSPQISVLELVRAAGIAAGGAETCAITLGGGLRCWGANGSGQLGDGTRTSRPAPIEVAGLTGGVAAVAVGDRHACAVTTARGVKCWGANISGQLGDGTTTWSTVTPVDVAGLSADAITVGGGGAHTCAVTGTGAVDCWGDNDAGQLETARRSTQRCRCVPGA